MPAQSQVAEEFPQHLLNSNLDFRFPHYADLPEGWAFGQSGHMAERSENLGYHDGYDLLLKDGEVVAEALWISRYGVNKGVCQLDYSDRQKLEEQAITQEDCARGWRPFQRDAQSVQALEEFIVEMKLSAAKNFDAIMADQDERRAARLQEISSAHAERLKAQLVAQFCEAQ